MAEELRLRGYSEARDSVGVLTGQWWSPTISRPSGDVPDRVLFESVTAAFKHLFDDVR